MICKILALIQLILVLLILTSPVFLFWLDWKVVILFNSILLIITTIILYLWRYLN